jgi:hypothetical protein
MRQALAVLSIWAIVDCADGNDGVDASIDATFDLRWAEHPLMPDTWPWGEEGMLCSELPVEGAILIHQLINDVPEGTGFLLDIEAFFANANNPLNAPDYFDQWQEPNCTATAWTAGESRAKHTEDAGDIAITGHMTPHYDDGQGIFMPLPSKITCERKKVGDTERHIYDCGLGERPMLVSEAVFASSRIDVSSTGGPCIPAISHAGEGALRAGLETEPDPSFDLNNVDPGAGITPKWLSPAPSIVRVSISIQDKNATHFASLTCSDLGTMKTKAFPQEVLDVAPKPTAGNPIEVRTSLIGFDPAGKTDSWGKYHVGVGRGHFGVTCVSTTGATAGRCP